MIRLFRRRTPADAARELARCGAEQRRSAWIAKRNATTRKICHEIGKPVPEALGR